MSDKPYLTDAEIREIADPLTQPAAIVRWFRDNGFNCIVKPNGLPLISRTHFEARAGNTTAAPASTNAGGGNGDGATDSPNVLALLNHFQKASHGKKTHQQPARAT